MNRSSRYRLSSALVVVALASCATTSPPVNAPPPTPPRVEPLPPPPDDAVAGKFYEVKAGDTLFAIARRHQLHVEDIAETNGLDASDALVPGQVLFLPDVDDPLALPSPPVVDDPPVERAPAAFDGTLAWPLAEGVVLRDFDEKKGFDGLLLAAPRGTPVLAAKDGEVLFVGDDGTTFGRMVILRHDGELLTVYAHLDEIRVVKGASVVAGAEIATVGETGRTESPQLHFQVRRGRLPVDPLELLVSP